MDRELYEALKRDMEECASQTSEAHIALRKVLDQLAGKLSADQADILHALIDDAEQGLSHLQTRPHYFYAWRRNIEAPDRAN